MKVITGDELRTLVERRKYLIGRAALKESVGWEHEYDEREAAALSAVIGAADASDVPPRCVVVWE